MNNLRKSRLSLLALVILIVAGLVVTYRYHSKAQAETMAQYVYCNTTVEITFPDRRFLGMVGHPAQGGMETVQTSLTMLDHDEMPPRPWPDGWQFSVHGSDCFESWSEMYDALSFIPFSPVASRLDPNAPLDEINVRQAVLKTLYKGQFEAADRLFPPAQLAIGEQ